MSVVSQNTLVDRSAARPLDRTNGIGRCVLTEPIADNPRNPRVVAGRTIFHGWCGREAARLHRDQELCTGHKAAGELRDVVDRGRPETRGAAVCRPHRPIYGRRVTLTS